jgi:hypothetical protein
MTSNTPFTDIVRQMASKVFLTKLYDPITIARAHKIMEELYILENDNDIISKKMLTSIITRLNYMDIKFPPVENGKCNNHFDSLIEEIWFKVHGKYEEKIIDSLYDIVRSMVDEVIQSSIGKYTDKYIAQIYGCIDNLRSSEIVFGRNSQLKEILYSTILALKKMDIRFTDENEISHNALIEQIWIQGHVSKDKKASPSTIARTTMYDNDPLTSIIHNMVHDVIHPSSTENCRFTDEFNSKVYSLVYKLQQLERQSSRYELRGHFRLIMHDLIEMFWNTGYPLVSMINDPLAQIWMQAFPIDDDKSDSDSDDNEQQRQNITNNLHKLMCITTKHDTDLKKLFNKLLICPLDIAYLDDEFKTFDDIVTFLTKDRKIDSLSLTTYRITMAEVKTRLEQDRQKMGTMITQLLEEAEVVPIFKIGDVIYSTDKCPIKGSGIVVECIDNNCTVHFAQLKGGSYTGYQDEFEADRFTSPKEVVSNFSKCYWETFASTLCKNMGLQPIL